MKMEECRFLAIKLGWCIQVVLASLHSFDWSRLWLGTGAACKSHDILPSLDFTMFHTWQSIYEVFVIQITFFVVHQTCKNLII